MTFETDIKNSYDLAIFFWNLKKNTEQDYFEGKITRKKRNMMIKEIRDSRNATMKENDPLTKNNNLLKEIYNDIHKGGYRN